MEEIYLVEMKNIFEALKVKVHEFILETKKQAKNHENIAKASSQLTQLKFNGVENLNIICGEVSQTFLNTSAIKEAEEKSQAELLKQPVEDILLMVVAAQEACQRRKALIKRQVESVKEVEGLAKLLE